MAVGKFDPSHNDRSATMSLMGTCEVGAVDGKTRSEPGDERNVRGGALDKSRLNAS